MPKESTKSKKKKQSQSHSSFAARSQSGRQTSQSVLSFRSEVKSEETKRKHSADTGAISARKEEHSTATGESLSVKRRPPASGSRTSSPGGTIKKRDRRKMESMDWECISDSEVGHVKEPSPERRLQPDVHGMEQRPQSSSDISDTGSERPDHHYTVSKAANPFSATKSPTLTGKSENSDHEKWSMDGNGQIGGKGQSSESPSAAGGDSHKDDSTDVDDDPDAGGYASPSDDEKAQKPKPCNANQTWKGMPLSKLKRTPYCLPADLKLERSKEHHIAIRLPFKYDPNAIPDPYFEEGRWDTDHVRMPFASGNRGFYDGKERKQWDAIVEALKEPIRGSFELEEAILKYNQRYINKWKFTVLHHYFSKTVSKEERREFFDTVLPMIVHLAKKLPDICCVVPLLKKGKSKKLTLSQHQISSLLANAFLCTFPLRNARSKGCEYSDYPDINFSHLFVGEPVPRKLEKMRCIVHYFKRVLEKPPTGIVTFSRQVLSSPFKWYNSLDSLTELHVSSSGTIEDNGEGMLQVDFANKYLGGGVLGHGCVQEEIRFLICPEMIITRLFTQSLDNMESLVMTGCERYSEYEGYADTFRWKGNYDDKTPRDSLGRLCCDVVAIDAMVFKSDYMKQFKLSNIDRELNKAYSGFKTSLTEANTSAVCTGNWGCGAFGGDKQLKALIQIMAASVAKRDVCYFTFGDKMLTKEIFDVHDELKREEKTVGDIFRMLEGYSKELGDWQSYNQSLFQYIRQQLAAREIKSSWRCTH